ncbi:putative holin-like toxin [Clostridium botulinum]|nr:putative holin-like toxin [Clostridium botulinum]NFP02215.1 putative holin-like toxin [Clostridium botulinum]
MFPFYSYVYVLHSGLFLLALLTFIVLLIDKISKK